MHDLGTTLRAWRDRLPAAAAGLPTRRGRRATGLRREELADLAGVSVDYLVRLEQGRALSPSPPVVASLARALQLSGPERDHLYRLASLVPPAEGSISDHVPPGVQRVVARLGDAAVAIFAADWQLIWWNRGWSALLGDPGQAPARARNFARSTFPVDANDALMARSVVVHQDEEHTRTSVVADLRRATGRFPDDPRLRQLVEHLLGNEQFAQLWARSPVAAHREDHKTVHHASVGPIEVDCDVLTDGDLELKIVILTAAPGTESETKLSLAMVAGALT